MALFLGPAPPLCPDWVFLGNFDFHIAKDRLWLTDYTLLAPGFNLENYGSTETLSVVGIGSVKIPVKREDKEDSPTTILHLADVLHVPSFDYNVIGTPVTRSHVVEYKDGNNKSRPTTLTRRGQTLVSIFIEGLPLPVLPVKAPEGKMLGKAVIHKDTPPARPSCRWPEVARKTWNDHCRGKAAETEKYWVQGLTSEEKADMKELRKSNREFLLEYGLRMHNETDREEAKLILRELMSKVMI